MSDNNSTISKDEIEKLVIEVKTGNHDAFSQVYDFYIDQIYRYVYYRVKSEDSEDLTETVFLKVWENIASYKHRSGYWFSAWIFRIAHNLVVDYYRSAKNRDFDELGIDIASKDRQHNPIREADRSFDKRVLRIAIGKIRKSYQDIIVYKFLNELSNAEIAVIMKKSEGSLRILQHRALKALKIVMADMGVEYDQ